MRRPLAALALALALAGPAASQTVYQTPPPELARLADAPATPGVILSPDRTTMLLVQQPEMPTIAELSQPEARLAGVRINPRTNGPSRAGGATAASIQPVAGGAARAVTGLPANPRLRGARFSPDGRMVAMTHDADTRVELWVLDVTTALARRVGDVALNEALGGAFAWMPSSDGFVVRLVPATRPALPAEGAAPAGPVVQESTGRAAPARTYQDLLATPEDEATFAHFATAQAARVSLDGRVTPLGEAGLVARAEPSPDGRYILVDRIELPFSYLVPVNRFPRHVDVIDANTGALVRRVATLPLQENVPVSFDAVPTGPRGLGWRADAPATLAWAEALDEGDARKQVTERDRVLMLAAPFTGDPVTLATLGYRFGGVDWGRGDLALVYEQWRANRRRRVWRVSPDAPATAPKSVFDLSSEDRYGDPGQPLSRTTPQGTSVLVLDGDAVFLTSTGASTEGDRPFLRRHDLATGESRELFRSQAPFYERPVTLLDDRGRVLLTQREGPTEAPNFWARDLVRRIAPRQVTTFAHPYPELRSVQKELIQYTRADGVPLSATLYLPAGYEARRDGPLPTLVWAYPQEFKSADAAGQVTGSPYRFNRVAMSGAVPFVLRGYAVLDNAAIPIVGEGTREPNDTFVEQLVDGARAAILEGVRRGVVDSSRVGVGGHSYGAFMTANLLAHSNLFRAGLARSGAYNRTLTPFGFQGEERTYWQAPEVYDALSPFQNADRINEPLLMLHGMADNNSGTFPIQSERLYNAVKGLGGTTRLVMLPHESHGYAARESVLHMLWEMDRWLEQHVKNAPPRGQAAPMGATGGR